MKIENLPGEPGGNPRATREKSEKRGVFQGLESDRSRTTDGPVREGGGNGADVPMCRCADVQMGKWAGVLM